MAMRASMAPTYSELRASRFFVITSWRPIGYSKAGTQSSQKPISHSVMPGNGTWSGAFSDYKPRAGQLQLVDWSQESGSNPRSGY